MCIQYKYRLILCQQQRQNKWCKRSIGRLGVKSDLDMRFRENYSSVIAEEQRQAILDLMWCKNVNCNSEMYI